MIIKKNLIIFLQLLFYPQIYGAKEVVGPGSNRQQLGKLRYLHFGSQRLERLYNMINFPCAELRYAYI